MIVVVGATADRARALIAAGRLADAEAMLLQLRAALGDGVPDLDHLAGVLALRRGETGTARALLVAASDAAPGRTAFWLDRAEAERRSGAAGAAVASCRRALALAPGHPAALTRLSLALLDDGSPEAALDAATSAAEGDPGAADPALARARALAALARLADGIAVLRDAVRRRPGHGGLRRMLAELLHRSGEAEAAVAEFRTLLALAAEDPATLRGLAEALGALNRYAEAQAVLARALALQPQPGPEAAASHCLAGRLLGEAGAAPEDRLASYDAALRLDPASIEARLGRGNALRDAARPTEAIAEYEAALRIDPGSVPARFNLAHALLLDGRSAAGFAAYEARLALPALRVARPDLGGREWDGEAPGGRTLLVHCEQGFGDAIQFVRYIPELQARGARVVLEAPAPLLRLFATLPGAPDLLPRGTAPPAHDWRVPVMSLPHRMALGGTALGTAVPYLAVPPGPGWTAPAAGKGRRVGLVWAGRASHGNDRLRSLPAAALRALTGVPGVTLISLQKQGAAALAAAGLAADVTDWGDRLGDFAEAATALAAIDLLITVDTAMAHLAGAMGRPVWVLLPHAPDWRWGLSGVASPWYPTARLFRQPRYGDWAPVLAAVRAALAAGEAQRPAVEFPPIPAPAAAAASAG